MAEICDSQSSWTDLEGGICHVHFFEEKYRRQSTVPVKCRGAAFRFPDDDYATMITVLGLSPLDDPSGKRTQLGRIISLREPLRRAKVMKVRNFVIVMEFSEYLTDEDDPTQKTTMDECYRLRDELGVTFNFVGYRQKNDMTEDEREVVNRAEHACRLQGTTTQFPDNYLDSVTMDEVSQQPYLPGCHRIGASIVKEDPNFIEEKLKWRMDPETYLRYSELGWQWRMDRFWSGPFNDEF